MRTENKITCFLLVFMVIGPASASVFEDASVERNFEDFLEITMNCRKIPGLTLSIVKGNTTSNFDCLSW